MSPKHKNIDLSKEFNSIDFTKLLFDQTVSFQEISLHLPRFSMSFNKEISPELKSLGLKNAYEGGLEKTGIAKRGSISLSFLNHDAVIKVEEKGTKAAAVTSGGAVSRGIPRIPETVKFDNPFYFSIINTKTTAILFWGKISNPKNWKG